MDNKTRDICIVFKDGKKTFLRAIPYIYIGGILSLVDEVLLKMEENIVDYILID